MINNNFKKMNTKKCIHDKVNMFKRGLWVTSNEMQKKFLFHFIQNIQAWLF